MADDLDESPNGHGPEVLTSRKASPEEPMRKGETEVIDWVEGLYTEAAELKKQQCDPDMWESHEDVYWGETWPSNLPSYKPPINVNEIQSLALQETSDLTDSRLQVFVQKQRGSLDRDENAEQTLQTYWTRRFVDLTVMNAALDGLIFPLGFFQSGWDPLLDQGQGEAVVKARNPASVYPDGTAEDDDEMRYFVLEDILDLIDIRRRFPETGWLVQPEAAFSTKADDRSQQRPAPRSGSGYTGPLYAQTPSGLVAGYQKARARVLTCVVDDDDLKEEVQMVAGQLRGLTTPKYPHKHMMIVANRRVLYNDDSPYHHAPILQSVTLQPRVHGYWPRRSILSQYADIVKAANKADSLVVENMLRCNIGLFFADADCGIDPKTWAPVPGLFTLVKPGSKVQDTKGTPMDPQAIQMGERLRGYVRHNFGYPQSRQGSGTAGNVSAELTETEISQAMGLTRLRGRLLYQSVQKLVEMIFARMAQFYTVPRHLPYIEGGELKAIKWEPITDPSTYAVHVDPSSFQLKSKTLQQRLYLALAKMNKFPTGRLLKALEIPDAAKIGEELKQELMLQALARQQQKKARR